MHRSLAAIAFAVAGAVVLVGVQPPRAFAAEGYGETGTSVYRLDPAKGLLRVTVTLKVTNRTPDTNEPYACVKYSDDWFPIPYLATCDRTTRYYLTTTSALVENEASSIRAVSGGKRLEVSAGSKGAWYRGVTVTFPKLFYGKTRTVTLTYVVKGGAPRSESSTRTMQAYASFCAIANGADKGSVTVRIPKDFAVDTTGKKLKSKTVGKERVFTSGTIAHPTDWFACFTGTNKAGYRTQKLAAPDGRTIALRSWPEDPAWAKGVRADVASSLPLLERLTGTSMTGTTTLNVQESSTGNEYAGFYDADTNTVTVGEDFNQPSLVEHELAHVWFNGGAFKETWISEGFAGWAARAVSEDDAGCTRPDASPASITLAEWRYLEPRAGPEERAAVDDQYQAACYVVTAVATAAGEERMTAVVSALLGRRDPYAADPSSKRAAPVATWKDWLDAVDELALAPAGAPDNLASDLLLEYGVAGDRALLTQRATVRQAYRELLGTVDGWVVPTVVRAPLAAWKFSAAGAAIEAAGRTWELTGETDTVLEGVDARHGPAAVLWERAATLTDLEAAADLAARQLGAARDVADALALVEQPLDVVQQVGLFGTQIPIPDAAIPAVRAGDGDAVAGITAQIRASVAGLRATGEQRIAVGGITLALLLAMFAGYLAWRARNGARRRADAHAVSATMVASSTAGTASTMVAGSTAGTVAPSGGGAWRPPAVDAPPLPWSTNPLDNSPTQVWEGPIVPSDMDPDLGALVRPARTIATMSPPPAPPLPATPPPAPPLPATPPPAPPCPLRRRPARRPHQRRDRDARQHEPEREHVPGAQLLPQDDRPRQEAYHRHREEPGRGRLRPQ